MTIHIKNCDSTVPVQGQEWTTAQMQEDFEAIGFVAPFVVVRRRSDGVKGTLEFKQTPRVYFGFHQADS